MSKLSLMVFIDRHSGGGVISSGDGNLVTVAGAPARRRLLLIDRQAGTLARVGYSGTDGQFSFPDLNLSKRYVLLGIDHQNQFNAAVADNLQPVPQ